MGERHRLDSWKEIAAYLDRDVRTTQRWEKDLGLPVRRIQGGGRASVFAYSDEIDAWLQQRDAPSLETSPSSYRRLFPVVAGLTLVVVAVLVWAAGWFRSTTPEPPPGGWLLIVPFENRTADPQFAELFASGLQRFLINRGYTRVVSEARIGDALELLGFPRDRSLDLDLARQVARVDGEIRLLLNGSLNQAELSSEITFEFRLLDASSGRTLRRDQEALPAQQLALSMDRIAARLAGELGEGPSRGTPPGVPLQEAVGGDLSLRAIYYYNLGLAALQRDDRPTAEKFLLDALREEPDFASALIYLAWVQRTLARNFPPGEGPDFMAAAEKARRLAEGVPDAERYFILASFAHLNGNYEEAIPLYRALLDVAPDHHWGNRNLLYLSEITGNFERARILSSRIHEIRPWDPISNFLASTAAVAWGADFERARGYVDRMRPAWPGDDWISNFDIFDAWYHDDLETVENRLEAFSSQAQQRAGGARFEAVRMGGFWYMALGQFGKAREHFQLVQGEQHHLLMMLWAFLLERPVELAEHAKAYWALDPTNGNLSAALVTAPTGLAHRQIDDLLRDLESENNPDRSRVSGRELLRGASLSVRGENSEAIRALQAGLVGAPKELRWLLGWRLLVSHLVREGRTQDAILELNRLPRSFAFPEGAAFWVKSRTDLARLIRQRDGVEHPGLQEELEILLKHAEPEFKTTLLAQP